MRATTYITHSCSSKPRIGEETVEEMEKRRKTHINR